MPRSALLLSLFLCAVASSPARAAADRQTAETLTQLAAVAASEVEGTEVLSSRDIEEIVKLEADKQLMGCSDETDCLAEVAGALGARFVVFSQLGQLDDQLVLTLNLFDGADAKSLGRRVVRGDSVSVVGDGVGPAVTALLTDAMGEPTAGEPRETVRVLVMDVRLAGGGPGEDDAEPAAAEPSPLQPILLGTGGVVVGLSVLTAGVGAVFGAASLGSQFAAANEETKQTEVQGHVEARDLNATLANALFVASAVGVVLGAGVLGGALLVGGE